MKDPNCVFCQKIEDGSARVAPDRPGVRMFEPLNPVTPGHMLFIPSIHVEDAAFAPGVTGEAFAAAATYGAQMPGHFNLIANAGHHAGQTVFHLHVHYVPRRPGDGLLMPWGGVQ